VNNLEKASLSLLSSSISRIRRSFEKPKQSEAASDGWLNSYTEVLRGDQQLLHV
jgi:hypothetical protein